MTEPTTREEQLARDNVELFRRVQDLEAQVRRRDARISELKVEIERCKDGER